jgi:hypothetical protein
MTPPVLNAQQADPQATEMAAVVAGYRTESARTLLELVDESPILLIFLRHFGCSFCRQTLDDVSRIREQIEGRGVRPVFVHLGTPERAQTVLRLLPLIGRGAGQRSGGFVVWELRLCRQQRTTIVANQIPRRRIDKTYLLPKYPKKGYFRLVEVATLG